MRIQRIGVLLLGVAFLAACGGNDDTVTAPTITSVATTPTTSTSTTPSQPSLPPDPPKVVAGRITVESKTLGGTPVPGTQVKLQRAAECNPEQRDIPPGTAYLDTFTVTAGADGTAFVSVPLGCYAASATPPPNTDPVPEGMHSAFITEKTPDATVTFRFSDAPPPAPTPVACIDEEIVADLNLSAEFLAADTEVVDCVDGWAVIRWDVPGDNQRIVHFEGGGWTTYIAFPHDQCWSEAQRSGLPASYAKYFGNC